MSLINDNIKWLMIIIGVITCTMILTVLDPVSGQNNMFGAGLSGDLADIVVRSWAMLITITGGLLIYGALRPVHRKLAMVAASVSKITFVALVLNYGSAYMDKAMMAVVFDTIAVIVFAVYLFTSSD